MAKFLVFSITFFLSISTFAQGNPFLLVRKIQGIEQLSPILHRQLQRTSLQILTKQSGYDLLISAQDLPESSVTPVFAVESQINKEGSRYSVEARLLDIKSKKIVTKAVRTEIREEDLVRLYQAALESLFIPDKIPDNIPPEKDPLENRPLPPKNKKQAVFINPPRKDAIDLQRIIRSLKIDADKAISEVKDANKNDAAEKDPPPAPVRVNPSILSSAKQSSLKNLDPDSNKSKSYANRHNIQAGFQSRKVTSDALINTTTSIQALTLNGVGHLPLSYFNGKIAIAYDVNLSSAVSSDVEVPMLYSIAPGISWLSSKGSLGLFYAYESNFFSNVESPGQGLDTYSINPTHLKLRADFNFKAYINWNTVLAYTHTLSASSDFIPLKKVSSWSGAGFFFQVTPDYNYKNWKASLSFEQSTLQSQGDGLFSLNDTRFSISLGQSF